MFISYESEEMEAKQWDMRHTRQEMVVVDETPRNLGHLLAREAEELQQLVSNLGRDVADLTNAELTQGGAGVGADVLGQIKQEVDSALQELGQLETEVDQWRQKIIVSSEAEKEAPRERGQEPREGLFLRYYPVLLTCLFLLLAVSGNIFDTGSWNVWLPYFLFSALSFALPHPFGAIASLLAALLVTASFFV